MALPAVKERDHCATFIILVALAALAALAALFFAATPSGLVSGDCKKRSQEIVRGMSAWLIRLVSHSFMRCKVRLFRGS